jgi:RNA polymerase sigma factor (sigma-70 family)
MDDMNTKKLFDLFEQGKAGNERSKNAFFFQLRQLYLERATSRLARYRAFKNRQELEKDAQDLVQDFLETVWEKWEEVKSQENGHFIGWANTVLYNLTGAYVRGDRRRREKFVLIEDSAPDVPDPDFHGEELMEEDRLGERLPEMIKKLSKMCQEILQLFLEGLERKQVLAAFPFMPRNTLYKRLFDCRKKLKELLIESGFEL